MGSSKMVVKPAKPADYKEVAYSKEHWRLLAELRAEATKVMTALAAFHLASITHGSVVRGDVKKGSDVDIFMADAQNSFLVETALDKSGISADSRFVVQATPAYATKALIVVNERVTVSFPLVEMRRVEREFYRFGGEAHLSQLVANVRVAGVDKRLMLIEPSKKGHVESSIIGREDIAARILKVSVETVRDRVRTLLKRGAEGRTGLFVKKELAPDETFELALKKLADENPAVRRRAKAH